MLLIAAVMCFVPIGLISEGEMTSLGDVLPALVPALIGVVIAAVLAIEMKGLLIGETASDESEEAITAAIGSHPLVNRVIHLKTQHIGPDELLVEIGRAHV